MEKSVLKILSDTLNEEFGKGYSVSSLTNMRKFYLTYKERISEPLVTKFVDEKSQPLVTIFDADIPFKLSWTHYLILMRIQDPDERNFYEELAVQENWGKRELSRQYGSSLYERLLIGKDIMKLSRKGRQIERPEDLLKDPYVLEFLGIPERADFSETERRKQTY